MAANVQVTFDAQDPHALARWWAERLGYEVEDGHEMIRRLLDDGVVGGDDVVEVDGRLHFADAVAASDPDGRAPRLYFQRVPETKTAKNRLHLDVTVPQERLDAEVEQWTGAGAGLIEFRSHPGHRWAVLTDPEGNEFCLH